MNLKEFVNNKATCPICGNKLHIKLSSTRTYKFRYMNDNLVFSTTMTAINKSSSTLHVDIIVSIEDNSFYIDFYDRGLKRLETYIPLSFMNSFKEFNANQKNLVLERKCGHCYQYGYVSTPFNLLYSKGQLSPLLIDTETICYYKKVDPENTRVFKISFYARAESSIISYKEVKSKDLDEMYPFTGLHMEFTNKITCPYKLDLFDATDSNIDKLETLLTFS
jgi:hypothetical protein